MFLRARSPRYHVLMSVQLNISPSNVGAIAFSLLNKIQFYLCKSTVTRWPLTLDFLLQFSKKTANIEKTEPEKWEILEEIWESKTPKL